MRTLKIILLYAVMVLVVSCGDESETVDGNTRSFYIGFTPWPYAATVAAIDDTYAKINAEGDIIQHQLMGGIPWQEALENKPEDYHQNVKNDINEKIAKSGPGKVIYLSVDPLNSSRDNLVPYWAENYNESLASHSSVLEPWNTRDFDSPEVITAFTHFSLDMIGRFHPKYFNYATEVSELIIKNPVRYARFKTFAQQVYTSIKAVHPDLIILVSVAFKSPGSAEMSTIKTGMTEISAYYDMLGISIYPYAFFGHADKGDPANLPSNWFSQVTEIAGTKPIAVTETGWIAEDLDFLNPAYTDIFSDPSHQNEYTKQLFSQANALNAQFIIWFTVVDYDALWATLGSSDEAKVWRDSGLYDQTLAERPALATWRQWFLKPRR